MNLKITLPKNWTPDCEKSINKWFDKIHKEAIKVTFQLQNKMLKCFFNTY